ncbi:MAG: thrombospondin type 3 repeat-containing protein, partial [bacterium]|nr:thrombospondin type 3 repeat-containing protein [bacterium]
KYTIQIPPYQKGTMPLPIFKRDYVTNKIVQTVIQGSNTANSKSLSKEAGILSKIDTDLDGLPNSIEIYIGTNINKKDTDGDTYSDAEELKLGSDPLGPGKLNYKNGGGFF